MKRRVCFTMLFSFVLFAPLGAPLSATEEQKPEEPKPEVIRIELGDFKFDPPARVSDPASLFVFSEGEEKLSFYTDGPADAKFKAPADDEYEIVITASGDPANDIRPKFKVCIDEKAVEVKDKDGKPAGEETTLTADYVKDYKLTAPIKAGEHTLRIEFTNDTYKEGEYDSNFYVHGVKLVKKK